VRILAAPAAGALHLVRVLEAVDVAVLDAVRGAARGSAQETHDWALAEAKAYLAATTLRLRAQRGARVPHITWSVVVNPQFGTYAADVASAILRAAEECQPVEAATAPVRCALVVMATHGRTGLTHMIVGRASPSACCARAPCRSWWCARLRCHLPSLRTSPPRRMRSAVARRV
jgi:nucleotide-binding universal stress UspA family protein